MEYGNTLGTMFSDGFKFFEQSSLRATQETITNIKTLDPLVSGKKSFLVLISGLYSHIGKWPRSGGHVVVFYGSKFVEQLFVPHAY